DDLAVRAVDGGAGYARRGGHGPDGAQGGRVQQRQAARTADGQRAAIGAVGHAGERARSPRDGCRGHQAQRGRADGLEPPEPRRVRLAAEAEAGERTAVRAEDDQAGAVPQGDARRDLHVTRVEQPYSRAAGVRRGERDRAAIGAEYRAAGTDASRPGRACEPRRARVLALARDEVPAGGAAPWLARK